MGVAELQAFRSVLVALVFCLGWGARADAADHLVFCYDPYPPYTTGAIGDSAGGLKVRLLDAVVDRIDGVTAEVMLLPWKRCQEQARTGAVDGILPLFVTPERAEYLAFSDAAFDQENALFYRRVAYPNGFAWSGQFSDISNLRLGMVNGSVINTQMEAAFEQVRPIVRIADTPSLFGMLSFGRVDLVAMDLMVGQYQVQMAGLSDDILPAPDVISARTSHFGLSKASGADTHLDAFNRALADMHAMGLVNDIYRGSW